MRCCPHVPGRGKLPHRCQSQLVGGRCGLSPIPLFPILWQPGLEASQAGPVPLCKRCARVKSLARLLQGARSLTAKRKPAETSLGWHGPRGEEGDGPCYAHPLPQIKPPPPRCCRPGAWSLPSRCGTARWLLLPERASEAGEPVPSVCLWRPACALAVTPSCAPWPCSHGQRRSG